MSVADVVVVGGGIGGAALAHGLAGAGLGVTLVEATLEYPDRVRGEAMVPWGVQEARTLGLEDALLAAGGHVAPLWKQYSEGIGGRRVRFAADVFSVAQAEDADNRSARRALVGEKMATMDPEVFPVILAAFAGPESMPQELLDPGRLDRIRSA